MSDIVSEQIKKQITENDIVLYMKGTAVFPQCGFSASVIQILDLLGVEYKDIDILPEPELREGIKAFTEWPTIPQLYVKGEFVGGCDIIREMYQNGELQTLMQDNGIKINVDAA